MYYFNYNETTPISLTTLFNVSIKSGNEHQDIEDSPSLKEDNTFVTTRVYKRLLSYSGKREGRDCW